MPLRLRPMPNQRRCPLRRSTLSCHAKGLSQTTDASAPKDSPGAKRCAVKGDAKLSRGVMGTIIKTKLLPFNRIPCEVRCPHCGASVKTHRISDNEEGTSRCYLPCGQLFAIRWASGKSETAKIAWPVKNGARKL